MGSSDAPGRPADIDMDIRTRDNLGNKDKKVSKRASNPQGKKLVVCNVHGMLLDCSLFLDKNSNTSIRPTLRTTTRPMIFQPGLIDFLTRCFVHFEVAF